MADELSGNAKIVLDALKKLGATNENTLKTADDVMKAAKMGKGQVNAALMELVNKKIVRRVAREKSAGYYILTSQSQ
ncbi:MAG: transcriptional regulator [Candidatus Micrarchaeia archaeon]